MIDRIADGNGGMSSAQLEEIQEKFQEASAIARERLTDVAGRVRHYAQNEPARALAVALGMGVLLGWLIKRR